MNISKTVAALSVLVLFNIKIHTQQSAIQSELVTIIPYKQAKGRIKAIVRDYMIHKQQIKNPLILHANWREVRKYTYKNLKKNAYPDTQDLVVDENVIPEICRKVFKQLVMLQAGDPLDRRKKYVTPKKVYIADADRLVRKKLRAKGIILADQELLRGEIMRELEKYADKDIIEIKIVETITCEKIKKFKDMKQELTSHKSYIQEFFENWKQKFKKQLSQIDLTTP